MTLTDKIALLQKIKNQPPKTSHCQLAGLSGVPRSTTARVIQQQERLQNERTLRHGQQGSSQKCKHKDEDADVEDAFNHWFSIVTGRGVRDIDPALKIKSED